MPEGDTVFRTAAHLHRAFAGKRLTRGELRLPRLAERDLTGSRTVEVRAQGKHVLHVFEDAVLHTHLGMDGAWWLDRPGRRWRVPAHRVRIVLEAEGVQALGAELAVVELLPPGGELAALAHLGPDLLGTQWQRDPTAASAEAAARLGSRPDREFAGALLDQRNLAGLGNEYVTELAFLLGVRPTAAIGEAGEPERVVALAHRLILANRDRLERSFTGDPRPGRRTWVYGRERMPCRRCGTLIRSGRHGGGDTDDGIDRSRRSAFCPNCQPAAGRTPAG